MASLDEDWKLPGALQPKPHDYAYDLDRALSSVVGLSTRVPADAFTAEILGTERAGHGVLIREDGLVLTIGYLITEAEEVWLRTNAGRVVQGHVVAYDQVTGFGLVQALGQLDIPVLPIGDSSRALVGEQVVVAGMGGRARSIAAHIVARQEFAGYWEYLLEEAIFTEPSHPDWGGTALIGSNGELLGIGSLQLQGATPSGETLPLNMIVPIDLLTPILDDVTRLGRPNRPPRPWLGVYASETENKVLIIGLAPRAPAEQAGVEAGDIVLAVAGRAVGNLASFFRRVWALGDAGVDVPLTIHRAGRMFELRISSADRNRFLKAPRLH
jgi:S1-C subfamily serine protease